MLYILKCWRLVMTRPAATGARAALQGDESKKCDARRNGHAHAGNTSSLVEVFPLPKQQTVQARRIIVGLGEVKGGNIPYGWSRLDSLLDTYNPPGGEVAPRVGRKSVQYLDMEIGCAQPEKSIYLVFGLRSQQALQDYQPIIHWFQAVMSAAETATAAPKSPTPGGIAKKGRKTLRSATLEQRRNEGVGETGDPRETPPPHSPTKGIVRHDSHMRKSGGDPTGNRTRTYRRRPTSCRFQGNDCNHHRQRREHRGVYGCAVCEGIEAPSGCVDDARGRAGEDDVTADVCHHPTRTAPPQNERILPPPLPPESTRLSTPAVDATQGQRPAEGRQPYTKDEVDRSFVFCACEQFNVGTWRLVVRSQRDRSTSSLVYGANSLANRRETATLRDLGDSRSGRLVEGISHVLGLKAWEYWGATETYASTLSSTLRAKHCTGLCTPFGGIPRRPPNNEVCIPDEGEMRREWSSAGMKGRGKQNLAKTAGEVVIFLRLWLQSMRMSQSYSELRTAQLNSGDIIFNHRVRCDGGYYVVRSPAVDHASCLKAGSSLPLCELQIQKDESRGNEMSQGKIKLQGGAEAPLSPFPFVPPLWYTCIVLHLPEHVNATKSIRRCVGNQPDYNKTRTVQQRVLWVYSFSDWLYEGLMSTVSEWLLGAARCALLGGLLTGRPAGYHSLIGEWRSVMLLASEAMLVARAAGAKPPSMKQVNVRNSVWELRHVLARDYQRSLAYSFMQSGIRLQCGHDLELVRRMRGAWVGARDDWRQFRALATISGQDISRQLRASALIFVPDEICRISTLASHQGKPGSIPDRVTGFSQVGIVPDDAVGRRAFSGISRFPRPLIPAPLHIHFNHHHWFSMPRSVRREVNCCCRTKLSLSVRSEVDEGGSIFQEQRSFALSVASDKFHVAYRTPQILWGHSGSVDRTILSGATVAQWIERFQVGLQWLTNEHFSKACPNHVQFSKKGSDFISIQQPLGKRRRLECIQYCEFRWLPMHCHYLVLALSRSTTVSPTLSISRLRDVSRTISLSLHYVKDVSYPDINHKWFVKSMRGNVLQLGSEPHDRVVPINSESCRRLNSNNTRSDLFAAALSISLPPAGPTFPYNPFVDISPALPSEPGQRKHVGHSLPKGISRPCYLSAIISSFSVFLYWNDACFPWKSVETWPELTPNSGKRRRGKTDRAPYK
ncbi:hypothetical protein PR048_019818 [Dryococelus australis]|uniref:Uncharacterized protein n=1 Tax=Dryococelus australis TaxID=614101 RepID=A0ABQ9H4J3_9NEOP|nr:hypothetical protein PR048_019818 [Dryococelus australis]